MPCLRTPHPPLSKIYQRSAPCVLIGYAPHSKAYWLWDPASSRIFNSFHVSFTEHLDSEPSPLFPGTVLGTSPSPSSSPPSWDCPGPIPIHCNNLVTQSPFSVITHIPSPNNDLEYAAPHHTITTPHSTVVTRPANSIANTVNRTTAISNNTTTSNTITSNTIPPNTSTPNTITPNTVPLNIVNTNNTATSNTAADPFNCPLTPLSPSPSLNDQPMPPNPPLHHTSCLPIPLT